MGLSESLRCGTLQQAIASLPRGTEVDDSDVAPLSSMNDVLGLTQKSLFSSLSSSGALMYTASLDLDTEYDFKKRVADCLSAAVVNGKLQTLTTVANAEIDVQSSISESSQKTLRPSAPGAAAASSK